jgi:RNA polymerase sigma-70 factor (ECF subfamily)
VLLLRIVAGLNAEEVAQVVDKGAWAVRALQRRGLSALRRKISAEAVQL